MDCEKANSLMMKYMDGVLTESEAASLNRHIKTCGRCEEDFLAYDGIISGFSEIELCEPPEGFELRVMNIVRQLPEAGMKYINRPLFGVLGVFSVLSGLGVILAMNKEALLSWIMRYPALKPLLDIYMPVSSAVGNISYQASAALAKASLYLQQIWSNLYYVPLLLFAALAAAQFVIYRRERVSGK